MADLGALPGRGIKPLVSLKAHRRLAALVFLAVVLVGLPVVFIKGQPQYSATATVQISARYMKNLKDDGELDFQSNNQYRQFVEQQTKSVVRYDIVRDALAGLGDRAQWRRPSETEREAVDRLRGTLGVRAVPDTYLMEVSLYGPRKDGMAEIVNAVVETYLARTKAEQVYGSDVRVRTLEGRETELLKGIKAKTDQRTEMALKLGLTGFTGKEENPYDKVIGDMRSALADARNKRFDAEARLKAFQAKGETDITTRSVQEAVLIDPGLNNLKANLFKRRADLLIQLSGLTPEHPIYKEVNEELRRIEAEIANQTANLGRQVKTSLSARYETTVDQARLLESDMEREFAAQQKQSAEFANLYNQAMTLTLDLEQDRKELDAVRERLNFFAAEKNAFGFVRLVTPALPPEMPYGPGKKKILLLVLVAALFAAVAAPVAVDLADRRVHTVNDAERVLGIPALGWMVERSDNATRIFGEDLLRRLAGGLIREREQHGTRVFAFSSVKPGAGVSELVLALGKTLDGLGLPALVIEANAFKPDHRFDGTAPGIVEFLRGEASADACIQPATASLPARVRVGDIGDRRHIDHLDRLPEAALALATEHPFVLVDIPPILLSADAEIMASSLAHLVLVVEASGISAGELRRAGRQVEKLDPAAVGVVVNRVRPFEGGGYLHGLLVEYLTGRKLTDYGTQDGWLLEWRARLTAFAAWRPRKLFSRKT